MSGDQDHQHQPKSDVGGPVLFAILILASVVFTIWVFLF
jgi:hypothetical protein